jgi:hypothetical protein
MEERKKKERREGVREGRKKGRKEEKRKERNKRCTIWRKRTIPFKINLEKGK